VLRWLVQRDVGVIPKSVRPDRMAQNIDVFDFVLSDDEMARIAAMDTGASLFFDHRDPAMVSRLGRAASATDRCRTSEAQVLGGRVRAVATPRATHAWS
jgi:hypothetical protein